MPSAAERRAPFWLLLVITVAADRVSKYLVTDALFGDRIVPVIGDVFRLRLLYNKGAAFGLGNDFGHISRWIFLVVAIVAVPILYKLWKETPNTERMRQYAFGFVEGGAVGNGIDRIMSSRGVIDFIDIGIPNLWSWPTFNVADIAVSCGAVVLAISLWREDARNSAAKKAAETASAATTVRSE